MSLTLHAHPLASFCWKVLIGLYENDVAFENVLVDLGDPAGRAAFLKLSPMGKMPALRDESRGETVIETSVILDYLDAYHLGPVRFVPESPDLALRARFWDRFFDLYVQTPMQKIVADKMRAADAKDPQGESEARATLAMAYDMIERQLANSLWITGDSFTMADCAAAPALFYSETLVPFGAERPKLSAYYERLVHRPSFARVLKEALPYFKYYPYKHQLPEAIRKAMPAE